MLSSCSPTRQYVSCIVDGGMDGDDVEVHAMPLYHCAQLDCFLGLDIYLGATSIVLRRYRPVRDLEGDRVAAWMKWFLPADGVDRPAEVTGVRRG